MIMKLGRYGVFGRAVVLTTELARILESLGYGTVWEGGSPPAELSHVEAILDATSTIMVATGIVNVWRADAVEVARSYHRIEAAHPGRFLLGIGIGHPESTARYHSPYQTLVEYLDVLDAEGVPAERRILAALGPRVLRLAGTRTAGAHPYLVTPEHSRLARETLGPRRRRHVELVRRHGEPGEPDGEAAHDAERQAASAPQPATKPRKRSCRRRGRGSRPYRRIQSLSPRTVHLVAVIMRLGPRLVPA
jgi:probable F420-dependent oxidoreductase